MPDVSARGGNASVIAATKTHLVARRFLTLETLRGVAAARWWSTTCASGFLASLY